MKILFLLFSFCHSLLAYDTAFFDYSRQIQNPTAVAIIAYNRPHYFKQLLDSLAENPESQTLPFFFFLDGGSPDQQVANRQLIDQANLAHKIIIEREINYGCPKNHLDSKRFLFDWCNFERIVVLEEDLVVSKNYLKTLLSLHDWAIQNYTNIGTVQLWSNCRLNRAQKQANLRSVRETTPHWTMVTYCLGKNVWKAISPLLSEYEKFIDPLLGKEQYNRARSKPGSGPTFPAYQKWIKGIVASRNKKATLKTFPNPTWPSKYNGSSWYPNGEIPMNQDQITSLAIWLAGYTRIQTTVNRVIHIGNKGISKSHRTQDIYLDEFPEDASQIFFRREN